MSNGKPNNPPGQVKFKTYITAEDGSMSFSLRPGETHQLNVNVRNKSGVDITSKCTFIWTSTNPSVATVSQGGLVTGASSTGNCNITVKATYLGQSATSTPIAVTNLGAVIVPPIPIPPDPTPIPTPPGTEEADTPAVLIDTRRSNTPSLGIEHLVHSGDDIQAIYNAAAAGDILTVDAGAIFPVNLVLGVKSGMDAGHYVTIRKSGTLPPEGTNIKISPTLANSTLGFPLIRSTNIVEAMYTNGPVAFVRFIGIAFDVDPVQTLPQGVVALGDASETNIANIPHHIILDACAVGSSSDTQDCRRGIRLNGSYLSVVDCAVTNIKSGFDSQAISGTNGPGPFKIYHNLLESAGENIAWGGGDPHISGLIPSDIDVRYNFMTKRMSWLNSVWTIKNHYESKNSRRGWLRGNIFENVWPSGQNGLFISLWSVNQDRTAPWSCTSHQTLEYNLLRNGVTAYAIGGILDDTTQIGQQAHHFTFKHNMVLNLDVPPFSSNVAPSMLMGKVDQLVMRHNDLFGGYAVLNVDRNVPFLDLIIENNKFGGGGQFFSGFGQNSVLWNLIAGAGSRFVSNIFAAMLVNQIPGNMYPPNSAAIDLSGGEFAMFGTSVAGMKLNSTSPYKNQANDGTDPGVNTDALASELALTATAV